MPVAVAAAVATSLLLLLFFESEHETMPEAGAIAASLLLYECSAAAHWMIYIPYHLHHQKKASSISVVE